MKKATVSVATLATIAASLFGVFGIAGSAGAKSPCVIHSKSSLIPYVVSPCNGATVKSNGTVTFRVYDANSKAGQYHPFLNLQFSRKLKNGHLGEKINGNTWYTELHHVSGKIWEATSPRYSFPAWWDNRAGTYYVQIQQVDDRAGNSDQFYSPITTVKVP